MPSLKWKIAQQLEIRWWKSYLSKKNPTDYLDWKMTYWKNFLKHCVGVFDINTVQQALDAGCGPAGINMVLPGSVTAIDPLYSKYLDIEHFNPAAFQNVSFVESTIEDYSSSNQFDLVCCLNVINHVKHISAAVENLFQLTSEEGWLLFSIDAHNYSVLKHLFRLIPGDALHPHQLDIGEYRNLLSSVGFNIQKEVLIKEERIFNYYLLIAQKPINS